MKNNWPKKSLDNVTHIYGGGTPRRNVPEYWGEDIPWLTMKDTGNFNITGTVQHISQQGLQNSNAQLIPAGSVNLSCTATVGSVTINKIPLTTNQQFNSFYPHDGLIPEFLAYELIYRKKEIQNLGGKTTIPFISKAAISNFPVHIPPIKLQRRIVSILSSVDDTINKTDQIIQKTELLKQGLLKVLLSRGIGHKKFKKTIIGEIPNEWDVKFFEEFSILQRGFDLPIQSRTKGQYDLITSNGITDTHNIFKVKGPGVVTGRSGTLGKVFYIEKDFWPLNTTLYVKDFKGNFEKFVYYKILSFNISRFGTGTGVPTLNRNIVHKQTIAIPSIKEQQIISEILTAIDRKMNHERKEKQKFESLKNGLMHDIFNQKVQIN